MSQPVLIKAYGNIQPASRHLREVLANELAEWAPGDSVPVLLDGDLLLISFEGVYFPESEITAIIAANLTPGQAGKLDVLDLENWILRRYLFENGRITQKEAPLNNVLDYSGH